MTKKTYNMVPISNIFSQRIIGRNKLSIESSKNKTYSLDYSFQFWPQNVKKRIIDSLRRLTETDIQYMERRTRLQNEDTTTIL
jgi:hypothetical protein